MTENFDAASKRSNLHPGSREKNQGGINSQINNAKTESGPRWKPNLRGQVLIGTFKVCFVQR